MRKNVQASSLFDIVGEVTVPPPSNQHQLVLHTLMFPPDKLTANYWANKYHILKWQSRLGEVEVLLNKILVSRTRTDFTNRFGHSSSYVVYGPVLQQSEYLDLYFLLKGKAQ